MQAEDVGKDASARIASRLSSVSGKSVSTSHLKMLRRKPKG